MTIAAYLDSGSDLAIQLPWVVRIARSRTRELSLFVPAQLPKGTRTRRIEWNADDFAALKREIATFFDEFLGPEWWTTDGEQTTAPDDPGDAGALLLRVSVVANDDPISALLGEIADFPSLIATLPDAVRDEGDAAERRRQLMRDARCEVILVRPGQEGGDAPCPILVPCSNSRHSTAGFALARDLAHATSQPITALYVEPDIGYDAAGVGRRIVDQLVAKAVGPDSEIERRVAIGARPVPAIVEVLDEAQHGVVVMGTSRLGASGDRLRGSVGLGIARATARPTVIAVRAAIPLQGRTRRRFEVLLHEHVPQLEREDRIALVERVQSNSLWDFDFIALMSLSTLIAAMGLIVNSAAVIIGAMLVAPLMTPLIGVGLALVQGNPDLARISLRSVGLGFAVSLALSAALGFAVPSFIELTPEMLSRGWPLTLDLFVAFVSGLAAAYASSRPNLIAALPGVAIAAALVPPIATAGLAISLGDFDHAIGASLLYLTNMVAIVLATAVALWAVGLRGAQRGSRLTRIIGGSFAAIGLVLGIGLAMSPQYDRERAVVPNDLRIALAAEIPSDQRLRDVYFRRGALVIQLAGEHPPANDLAQRLSLIAQRRIGDRLPVRVQRIWEIASPAPPKPASPSPPP